MLKNYLLYYFVSFNFINQHRGNFDFCGLDYFRYLKLRASVYSPQKTKIPALVVEVVVFGIGFEFCTHGKA